MLDGFLQVFWGDRPGQAKPGAQIGENRGGGRGRGLETGQPCRQFTDAGQRVMDGLVKRGDGENLHAVIWFSDLRGSTQLAASLPREAYLAALNQYFDCAAGAVIEHGGEVLKFIGDAVLAIFPIERADEPQPGACNTALAAVSDALERMASVNRDRSGKGEISRM